MGKIRIRFGTIMAAAVALAAGVAAGWFAAGAWGERKCGNVELWNCGNVETANVGRARSPDAPDGRAVSMKPPEAPGAPEAGLEARAEKAGFSNEDAESIAESFRAIAETDIGVL